MDILSQQINNKVTSEMFLTDNQHSLNTAKYHTHHKCHLLHIIILHYHLFLYTMHRTQVL